MKNIQEQDISTIKNVQKQDRSNCIPLKRECYALQF